MIDLDRITWFQQWEFWLFYRLLRPSEFFKSWRWYQLIVPDQLWMVIGLYRLVKGFIHPPTSSAAASCGSGSSVASSASPMTRMQWVWELCRIDPVVFVAWGLTFIAEPSTAFLFEQEDNDEDAQHQHDEDEMQIDVSAGDARIAAQEEDDDDDTHGNGDDPRDSAPSVVSLPRSAVAPCRKCHKKREDPGYVLLTCGHFPYCQSCISSSVNRTGGFVCTQCEQYCLAQTNTNPGSSTTSTLLLNSLSWISKLYSTERIKTVVPSTPAKEIIRLASPELCENSSKMCPVCEERPGNLILMPCGHLGFCGVCVAGFKLRCPYCRRGISRILRGYDVRVDRTTH
ncbi:hypothetical protein Pmar_PMAR021134 [Perkinsus marinus ATCC 50983]|uniref:RING-type domain-containing protein n=1 Tax=Perkinsus marinus (strain ATCC 50983 / TXsc) TaxID=423536 RepID=C5KGH9_PERM5|nr:hypothetical protein Pmar_PMAR021134 [Perkinsus marinus ATCC 50983]EER16535.1 hypothetical protein Pmar_PMAR021134 [Perkinsus marinus ATCC 50983]|eukprot:XP_002784739.1 hypothetical protein Pmar_PMAR021134 [Perkinsus marinus ATCC 50983]